VIKVDYNQNTVRIYFMNNMLIRNTIGLIVLIAICSCRPIGRLSILDISDPLHPVICISREPHCIGALLSYSIISIDEVGLDNRTIKGMWWIQRVDSDKKFVTKYGELPYGWIEDKKAVPLELNKIYSVNRDYYFSIYKKNNIVKSIVSRHLETVHNKLTEK